MLPVALTIAGSDSGGGAGIQADLKAFARLEVHGATAITCITAQNRKKVARIHPCPAKWVQDQITAIFAESPPAAAKTGMLYSAEIVSVVVRCLKKSPQIPLVVDPVIKASSGRTLLLTHALKVLKTDLLPLAALVTPNVAEAEVLAGLTIRTASDMRAAAMAIHRKYGCAALVKGGHSNDSQRSIDYFCGNKGELTFPAPRIRNVALHGTGCAFSAAITAWLARGKSLVEAIERGKEYVHAIVVSSQKKTSP
jgi:hydroxymethylpyrimidine/phosphomethylpyrimidine kinase